MITLRVSRGPGGHRCVSIDQLLNGLEVSSDFENDGWLLIEPSVSVGLEPPAVNEGPRQVYAQLRSREIGAAAVDSAEHVNESVQYGNTVVEMKPSISEAGLSRELVPVGLGSGVLFRLFRE